MNWKINSLAVLCVLVCSCRLDRKTDNDNSSDEVVAETYYSNDHLIEAAALLKVQADPGITIIDFRKKESYLQGHITGALSMWRDDIEDTTYDYGGMMATRVQLEKLFSRLGIKNTDTLVVYDDRGSCDATRLWWILMKYNFNSVKVLNGGLDAWKASGGSIATAVSSKPLSEFSLPAGNSNTYVAVKEELLPEVVQANGTILIDSRTNDEYSGKRQKKGSAAGGRIPGSYWMDWVKNLDVNDTKKFKTVDELKKLYGKWDKAEPIIVYCHSGVRSAHTTFVLTQLLGFENVRNYDGSWTEWSRMESYPIEKDSITRIFK